jgi:uncharacterized RDD family membrane protein YckC
MQSDVRYDATSGADKIRAPFSLRCGALLIDYVALLTIMVFSTLLARLFGSGNGRNASETLETTGLVIALAAALIDLVVFAGFRGQTLGKWATGLRVERLDGRRMGFVRALIRHIIGYPLSFITLGLGFLIAIVNSRGRTLHDIIAGTIVVRDDGRRHTRRLP